MAGYDPHVGAVGRNPDRDLRHSGALAFPMLRQMTFLRRSRRRPYTALRLLCAVASIAAILAACDTSGVPRGGPQLPPNIVNLPSPQSGPADSNGDHALPAQMAPAALPLPVAGGISSSGLAVDSALGDLPSPW